jgi:hypothetical protein
MKNKDNKKLKLVLFIVLFFGFFSFFTFPVHAVSVSDTFDRANEDPIGGNWTKGTFSNNLRINNNSVVPSTLWQAGWYYWNADLFSNDQYSEGTLTTAGGGVVVRMSNSTNTYYLWTYVSGYEWQLRKIVNGVSTNLTGLITVGSGTNFARLEVNGNLLVAKVRGTVIASVFDSDISIGSPGIYGIYGGLSTWVGGDLSPSCAPGDCYTIVPCVNSESGTCREPADLSNEKVQTTINASADGDGIYLKSGSANWDSQVTIFRQLTFAGAGKENTFITVVSGGYCGTDTTNTCMAITSNNVDVSGIGFRVGHSGAQSVYIGGSYTGLKIHDNDFRRTVNRPAGNTHHVMLFGNVRGVIYGNYFYGGGVGFDGPDSGGLSSADLNWTSATGFGGTDFLFVEGNTFSNANSFGLATGGTRVMYANTGAKTVFRFNSLLNEDFRVEVGDIDGHSFCSGTRAARTYEIYNNLMESVSPTQRTVYLRGGTGLVYKNKIYPGYMQFAEYRVSIGQGGYGELICPYCRPIIETKSSSHCFSTYYGITTSLVSTNYPLGSTVHGETSGTNAVIVAQGTTANITFSSYSNGTGFINGESLTIGGIAKGTAISSMSTFHGEGYPCYDQIGRGENQNSEPYFIWDNIDNSSNPITPDIPSEMTSYIVEDRDYCNHNTSTSCNGVSVSYSSYQCPNPATGLTGLCDSSLYGVAGYNVLSSSKAVTSFDFNGLTPAVAGTINEDTHTVSLTVPYDTNVMALVPTIMHTGSSISPSSGVAQNFINTVTYNITAADSSTQEYVVTVTVAVNNESPAIPDNFDDEEDYDDLDISKVKYSVIDNNQIKITFKTNNYSKGTAQFGTDKDIKQKEKESKNKKKHSIKLKNLIPGVKHYFRISAEDRHGQNERTKIYSVTFPKTVAYAPMTSKTTPKPQTAAPINQNQNTQTPTQRNSNQNQTNENTDRNTDISNLNDTPNLQPQPQNKTFKWWNPFTWFW